MSDILDEISYEQSQEKITNFIVKYLFQIIVLFVVIIVSSSIYIWNQNKLSKQYQDTESLYNKILDTNRDQASKIEILNQVIKKAKGIYYQLALLEKGSLLIIENKNEEALNIYKQLYNNNNEITKYIAELFAISIQKEEANPHIDDNPFKISILLSQIDILSNERKYKQAVELCNKILIDYSINPTIKKKIEKLVKIFKMKNVI